MRVKDLMVKTKLKEEPVVVESTELELENAPTEDDTLVVKPKTKLSDLFYELTTKETKE